MGKFIKEEFLKSRLTCEEQNEEILELYDRLENLKDIEKEKEEEYQIRQKQVTTYLQCKRSFFGKIRYFFKGKNKIKDKKNEIIMPKRQKEETNKEDLIYDNKEYYTIEDLIGITKVMERTSAKIKNTNLDIKALEDSIERLTKRIENAKSYIDEIEEHKKSIFEFWSFVNKDNMLGLNEPEEQQKEPRKIEKVFDYQEDIEDFGKKQDKTNRERFSKEEENSMFIASTDIIEDINDIIDNKNVNFEERLENLKKEALEKKILFSSEEFDIFGTMTEDKTKIDVLGNTKHREIKKDKFHLIELNKNTNNEQYIEKLKEIITNLDSAITKAKLDAKLNTYFASTLTLNNKKYTILNIDPQNALDALKEEDKINLYSIRLNENTKAVALTNIIYYDNNNKTLPIRHECIR